MNIPTAIKIDPDAGKAWTAALDTGGYAQCNGHLKSAEGGYCCLGVFAKTMGATELAIMGGGDAEDEQGNMVETVSGYDFVLEGAEINSDDLLDTDWATKFGISGLHQSFFSALNDGSSYEVSSENHVLHRMMLSLALDPTTFHGGVHGGYHATVQNANLESGYIRIAFRKHSFFEISQIIKIWFL